ncbi:hypothetical protein JL721_1339 [Aureococcus anophagefferens]|nr:hypothetical protein JL721_1339 [Aureococcus anophagefferens]
MVMNALAIDPNVRWKGGWRWFDEAMVLGNCCKAPEEVDERGITMHEFASMARCHGAVAEHWHHEANAGEGHGACGPASLATFRRHVVASATSSDPPLVVASFDRSALGQTGAGHFSPLSAYDVRTDSVLVLDVARFKYPPWWVALEHLYDAMEATDADSGLSRLLSGIVLYTMQQQKEPKPIAADAPTMTWALGIALSFEMRRWWIDMFAKAYYRRARAREGLGELADAFRDLKACVRLEPANREAVALARSVKERLSATLKQEGAHESPAVQLALKISKCVESGEADGDARKRKGLFVSGARCAVEDEAAARALWKYGACDAACASAKSKTEDGEVRRAAVRMLAAAARHAGALEPSMVWQVAGVLRREGEGSSAATLARAGLGGVLSKEAAKKKKGLAAMFEASKPGARRRGRAGEAKEKEDLRRCRARRLGKVLELPDGPVRRGVLGGLWALLDAKHDGERRKAQAAVAVCAPSRRGDPAVSDVEFEWDSPDEAAPASLVAALVAAGGVSDDAWVSSFPLASRTRSRPRRLAAKALKSGARETGRLLDSAVALLRDALKRKEEVAEGVGDGDDVAAAERAVEVVAAMASASSVKEELAHGSGRCGAALPSLTALASASKGSDPVAYGLSCVFANLTVTNDELRRRHYADKEMDITAEQYDELQRITKQKAEDDADTDTADLCGARCVKLAMADGVLALANLAATDPSPLTSEHLAATLVALAKDENLRGRSCSRAASKPPSRSARPATGRTSAGSSRAARRRSSIDEPAEPGETRRVAANKGIHALEYLQFSDNDEVQRAATEALTNMVPDRDMIAHLLKPDKIKLWLAGKAALDHVLRSKEPSLVHRGAYCLANCLHDRKARLKLNDDDALMAALTQACDDLKQHTNGAPQLAAASAAHRLARPAADDEGGARRADARMLVSAGAFQHGAAPRVTTAARSTFVDEASPEVAPAVAAAPAPNPALDGLPSLFEAPATAEEAEFYESIEEALAKAKTAPGVDGPWDAAFWREYDGDGWVARARAAEGEAAALRLAHHLTAHRIISLSARGRNRTEFVSRYAPCSLAETDGGSRRVAALHCYAGLRARLTWDAPAWASDLVAKLDALGGGELAEAALRAALARRRRAAAADDDAEDRGQYLRTDQFFEEEFGTDFSDDFGELDESPLAASSRDDGASLAASLEALDDAFGDDDAPERRLSTPPAPFFVESVTKPAAAAPPKRAETHGRATAALGVLSRGARERRCFPGSRRSRAAYGPRHVSIMAQQPGTRTPSHSELQNHVLTLYAPLAGGGGAVDALEALYKLDEQFVLRRSAAVDVVRALASTDRALALLE